MQEQFITIAFIQKRSMREDLVLFKGQIKLEKVRSSSHKVKSACKLFNGDK